MVEEATQGFIQVDSALVQWVQSNVLKVMFLGSEWLPDFFLKGPLSTLTTPGYVTCFIEISYFSGSMLRCKNVGGCCCSLCL